MMSTAAFFASPLALDLQILAVIVGAVVWLIRLEGRVNNHEREVARNFAMHERERTDMRDDIKYIRGRIDAITQHVGRNTLRDS